MSARTLSVPERASRYLATLPPAVDGQDGSGATFRAACVVVHGFALPEDVALGLLLAHYNPQCQPPWTEGDLRHKVRSAINSPSDRPRGYLLGEGEALPPAATPAPLRPKWPEPDAGRTAAAVQGGPSALELWKLSPVTLDVDDGSNAVGIVAALFTDAANPDPLLCVGKSSSVFATRPLSSWTSRRHLADFALIVPSPMLSRTGKTKDGRESEHTLENTGPRRFLVVEFDTGTANEHAARLWHLGQFAPLALVVHSGGKSLHGWYPVGDALAADVERFARYAASIGADPALFRNPSQFCRLPGGTRENACRQSVFYWDPATLATVPAVNVNGEEGK